jgi:hypothetical protein
MKKYVLTESQYNKLMDRLISEQPEHYNYNMAIQCFLNKKGIKDDSGQPLKMDGSIGTYPKSKSAQAILNYQQTLKKLDPKYMDGTWGEMTMMAMPPQDMTIFKDCKSEHGDIFDKGMHFLGLDD